MAKWASDFAPLVQVETPGPPVLGKENVELSMREQSSDFDSVSSPGTLFSTLLS